MRSETPMHMLLYDNTLRGMILIGISNYFLLCPRTSIFDLKALALPWRHVFYTAWNVWKWSPVHHCTNKMVWKILVSRTPLCFNWSILLSPRYFCINLYTCFPYLLIIRNAFEKWKNTEAGFWKEKTKNIKSKYK